MRRALVPALIAWMLAASPCLATVPTADPGLACRQAIQAAEREHRLPAALLNAIAKVESGRPDPRTGVVTPWPWTVNAEGQGRYFDSKAEAIAAVEALRARGVRLIDVGCLQVNLHHHPAAFASLDQAFEPLANARYAGGFLTRLYQAERNWEKAASRYHSSTPELGDAYRLKVLAAWPGMAHRLAEEQRRQAMIAAWSGGAVGARPAAGGRQPVQIGGLSLPQHVMLGRPVASARQQVLRLSPRTEMLLLELAEAPAWK